MHNHFKKCYVNVGAQPLSIKATKFPKWMWVYNNFKKLQNCKINVGVQDKAIHWLWEVLIFFPFRFSSFNLIQYPNDVEEFKWNFMFPRYILFMIYRHLIVKLSFSLLSFSRDQLMQTKFTCRVLCWLVSWVSWVF